MRRFGPKVSLNVSRDCEHFEDCLNVVNMDYCSPFYDNWPPILMLSHWKTLNELTAVLERKQGMTYIGHIVCFVWFCFFV